MDPLFKFYFDMQVVIFGIGIANALVVVRGRGWGFEYFDFYFDQSQYSDDDVQQIFSEDILLLLLLGLVVVQNIREVRHCSISFINYWLGGRSNNLFLIIASEEICPWCGGRVL